MEKFLKTDKEIKDQIINWFLKYHSKPIDSFVGSEEFTLFDKISIDRQKDLDTITQKNELPTLVLQKNNKTIIICTTRRFIYFDNAKPHELTYAEFKNHAGFKSIDVPGHTGPLVGVKTDGYISEFGLRKNDEQIVYWKITTGHSGIAFWNITQKFDIIGRKYIISETK